MAIDRRSPQRFFAFFAPAEIQATAAVVLDEMTGVATAIVETPAEPPVEGMIRRRHYRPPPKRRLPVIHAVAVVTLDDMIGRGRVRVLDAATRRRQREEEELLILLEAL